MKHSTQELIDTAYTYFPRGMAGDDPRYDETPEVLRQKAVRIPISAKYESWRAMLGRLAARFPEEQFPGVDVHNLSLFLQDATAGSPSDRCFTGELWLPVRSLREKHHELDFLISFVVPYYTIRSLCVVFPGYPTDMTETDLERSFDLSPDELPFAKAIAEEIERTFPGHEPMPPEVGMTIIPDIHAAGKYFGRATIFTCLFSDTR